MLKKILIVLAVLAAILIAFVIYVAMQPGEFRVERKAKINAPAEVVFDQVNDLHAWEAWSPWAKIDPKAKVTFGGPAAGKGAIFTWSGNDELGEGRMEITESDPHELVRIKLDFTRPFEASHTTEFKFEGEGAETDVTWSMTGRNDNLIAKAICLFMNMDEMLGKEFEKGLAQMKTVAEAAKKSS